MIDSWTLEAYLNSSWVDLSSDVHGSISGDWGIKGNRYLDRLASTGMLEFELRNINGEYSPAHASVTTGWQLNAPIRLTLNFDSIDYVYRFYISKIDVVPGTLGPRLVKVTCVDWIDYAAKLPLRLISLSTDQTADQMLTTIVSALPIAPQSTGFDTGLTTFPTAFDTIKENTRAWGEIKKVVN